MNVEELLIDFHELIGSHSGENLAAAVWSTMELYRLEGKVSVSFHAHYAFHLLYIEGTHYQLQ